MNNLQRVFQRGHIRDNKTSAMFCQKYHRALRYLDIVRHVRRRQATTGNTSEFVGYEMSWFPKICISLNIHEHKQDRKCFISLNSENWVINFQYSAQHILSSSAAVT